MGVLLIGQSGNGTVSWPTRRLLDNSKVRQTLRGLKNQYLFLVGAWKKDLLVTDELITKYHIKNYIKTLKGLNLGQIRNQLLLPGESPVGHVWHESGTFFKMEVRDPTLDLMLIKFLFGIPDDSVFYNNRQLFELNFNQYFPLQIINGNIRGIQASDLSKRIKNEIQKVKDEFSKNRYAIQNFISLKKLNKLLIKLDRREQINVLLKLYRSYLITKD
jgi:hypothetical protein